VNRGVDWVDFDGGDDIEAGLFETEAQATCACEKVDADWAGHATSLPQVR
jgi:hypothetical protein